DSVSGRIRWSATNDLVKTFKEQLASYRKGFVEVVKAAEETSSAQAAEEISRTQWEPAENELWDPSDGASPITHVHPSHSFVSDEIARVRAAVGGSLVARRSRTDALNVCRHIYNYFKTRRFAYEIEPRIKNQSRQAIRTPDRILNDKAATCL